MICRFIVPFFIFTFPLILQGRLYLKYPKSTRYHDSDDPSSSSNSTKTVPALQMSPSLCASFLIVPFCGDLMTVSIFIDSILTRDKIR